MIAPDTTRLEQYAESVVRTLRLPPCPSILASIGRELGREYPDTQRIAADIACDVSAAATLVKTVNSAWYGLAHKARSVQQAIAYLGLERTSLLLAGLLLRNVFPSTQRPAMARFWEVSSRLAVTLGFIARLLGRDDRDELHTFGLFRDVGRAPLIDRFDDYDALATASNLQSGPNLTESEQARYGTDHAVIGAVLARDWGLPEEMSDAILWHHADFVLDADPCPIAARAVQMIAIGVLGDRAIEGRRVAATSDTSAGLLDAALRVLDLDRPRYVALQAEVLNLSHRVESTPPPTLRLASAGAS